MMRTSHRIVFGATLVVTSSVAHALGGNPNVRFAPARSAFPLIRHGQPARVVMESTDWPGVARAAQDLQQDLGRVSGWRGELASGTARVLVGTLGKSPQIDRLVQSGKLDVRAIRGKWEASVTQVVDGTLVVAGADKRGTIYALYDLSESVGVSPWNWWADVPVKPHADAYVTGRYVAKSPAVKYRGIFLNDEAPALSNWVYANYSNYNHTFYERVFELLLRLRANYLWPAMWNNCFSQDDPLNPVKADEYGIVMGTSHVEPMMRADKEWNRLGYGEREWNYQTHPKELEKFWADGVNRNKPYENIVTMAMRGKIDTPMSETANIELLERIVAAERKILAENVNPDVTQIPQLWCLYKEVQEYYEKGMRVPDDITLLWADDNWGDIRRLPTPEERKRSGGAGVYYHFDYVGGPRNYKWLNTNPIAKIWEQMNLAYRYGADRIWIVNVGDLKPMEFPLEFFMTLARDPAAIRKEDLRAYTERWVAREFGPEHAAEIAAIMTENDRLSGRRKPELIDARTFSVLHYREAEQVERTYHALQARAEAVARRLPEAAQSAYLQLVLHPVLAMANLNRMYIAAARNALYAKQGRLAANREADRVRQYFAEDAAITKRYHTVNGGKWSHFMDQTHIGYTSWQEPRTNVMPHVTEVADAANAGFGIAVEGYAEMPEAPRMMFTPQGPSDSYLEVFRRGSEVGAYRVETSAPWIRVTADGPTELTASRLQQRLCVSIDWSRVPAGNAAGRVTVTGPQLAVNLEVVANTPRLPGVNGAFVEVDGAVAIEAEHAARRRNRQGVTWTRIPDYGRTLSGMTPTPVEFPSFAPGQGAALEYDIVTTTDGPAKLDTMVSPSLGFQPGRGLRLAIAFDQETPQVVDVAPAYLSLAWNAAVSDAVHHVTTHHTLKAGRHTLRVWAIDPGVVLQRFVLDLGGLKPSYLGPPESPRLFATPTR